MTDMIEVEFVDKFEAQMIGMFDSKMLAYMLETEVEAFHMFEVEVVVYMLEIEAEISGLHIFHFRHFEPFFGQHHIILYYSFYILY